VEEVMRESTEQIKLESELFCFEKREASVYIWKHFPLSDVGLGFALLLYYSSLLSTSDSLLLKELTAGIQVSWVDEGYNTTAKMEDSDCGRRAISSRLMTIPMSIIIVFRLGFRESRIGIEG